MSMASRYGFFRPILFRLEGRRKLRAARPAVGNGAAAQPRRKSARVLFPRFGGRPAARAGFAGTFGSMPDDLAVIYASIGATGAAATRSLIDSFLAVSRRHLCL